MSSAFEDSVINFDFSLLKPSSKNVGVECKTEKLRRDIHLVKKKTIATDSLIKKYFSKSELLDQTEKLLMTAKEECKKVCIDYNTALEKCTKWEKDAQLLSVQNKELQDRLIFSDNQYKAIQSHAHQLQMLIHQYETQIESLKIENQLEKSSKKDQTKPKEAQIIEYDNLLNDICLLRDIVLGKKKVHKSHKKILKKYEKYKTQSDVDNDSTTDTTVEEMGIFGCPSPLSHTLCHNNADQVKMLSKFNLADNMDKEINNEILADTKIDDDHDSDSGNEIISEDTGCGSSLGGSDTEKCFNSPDYFINDSPFSTITQKEKKNFAEIATSPITVSEIQKEVATSPIMFDNYKINHKILSDVKFTKEVGVTADPNDFIIKKHVGTSTVTEFLLNDVISAVHFKPIVNTLDPCILRNSQDKTTSPIQFNDMNTIGNSIIRKKNLDIATSPVHLDKFVKTTGTNTIRVNQSNAATSPICIDSNKSTIENVSNERECLEVNNSIILNDSHTDCEIETILSTMRLDHELITPIPKSPAKSRNHKNQEIGQKSHNYICQDAAKISAENDVLKVSIANLTNEILNIKLLLKNHLFLSEQELNNSDHVCTDTFKQCTLAINTSSEIISNGLHEEVTETIDTVTNTEQSTPKSIKPLDTIETQNNVEKVDQIESRNEQFDGDCLLKTSVSMMKKAKKLTRLDKLRKKLIPKCRIRSTITPIGKLKRKKQFLLKKKNLDQYPKSLEDNKLAYENAVKVMAEIRDKEKNKTVKKPVVLNEYNKCGQKLQVVLSKCDKIVQDFKNHSSPITIPIKSDISSNLDVQNGITTNNTVTPIKTTSSLIVEVPPSSHRETCITTRSRSKRLSSELSPNADPNYMNTSDVLFEQEKNETRVHDVTLSWKRLKPSDFNNMESNNKRLLRSSVVPQTPNIYDNAVNDDIPCNKSLHQNIPNIDHKRRKRRLSSSQKNDSTIVTNPEVSKVVVSYNELDLFSDNGLSEGPKYTSATEKVQHPKGSILCSMLEKYGKYTVRCHAKKLPEAKINSISKQLEDGIAYVLTVSQSESKQAMNDFVIKIQNINTRYLLAGFMKYLKDPARKDELFKKVNAPPAPPMTKSEQVLLYIIKQLQASSTCGNFIESILANIEFALFQLNHTPDFGVVESLSHFYAVICRYLGAKSRLRLFILDAMYCIQFKAVVLIKQCLEVWMHVLPLAHMGIAKSPLVTCLVYLLHFFKCEDRLNRVQEIRDILSRTYFYQITEWTESNILEMFKNAVNEIRDIPIEKKMLRMSLIILAKRRGPQWTQKNIVKNILQPLIENNDTREKVKEFCLLLLGPLLKPYPNDMKVHCEIVVNQLLEKLDSDITPLMKEAIISSLLFMKRHNQNRVIQALLTWNPEKISPELELLLRDYVREKPAKVWKNTLSRISVI